ncbi:MAG: hypothetical protein KGI28_00490 [Thaumarchaeota archaeon]|nr:hypothetical protein [Nitrososphaerota archaeon]
MLQDEFHFFNAIAVFIAAAVPVYLTIKLKNPNLKKLTFALAIFITIHGIYHLVGSLGNVVVAKGVLDPLSALALLGFGLWYLKLQIKKEVKA